jgi:hypothetical protein
LGTGSCQVYTEKPTSSSYVSLNLFLYGFWVNVCLVSSLLEMLYFVDFCSSTCTPCLGRIGLGRLRNSRWC